MSNCELTPIEKIYSVDVELTAGANVGVALPNAIFGCTSILGMTRVTNVFGANVSITSIGCQNDTSVAPGHGVIVSVYSSSNTDASTYRLFYSVRTINGNVAVNNYVAPPPS